MMFSLPSCLYDCTTVLLAVTVFVVTLYYMRFKRKKNFPPGPSGLPIVGYVPFATGNIGEKFFKMKGKYGSVMSVKIGPDDWVILNDFDVINEAFVKNGQVFSGRPSNVVFDMFSGGKGVAFADYGETWKNLRKFGLTTLRGFGVGKRGMEENVIEEIPYLIEQLTSSNSSNLKMKMSCAVSNIICRVVFGSRFNYDNKDFVELQRILLKFTEETWETQLIGMITLAPFLRHFPPFTSALKVGKEEIDKFLALFDKIKEEHKASFDENDIRDFIDAFLVEMKQNHDNNPAFEDGNLLQYIRDLFEAGTATTSSTLVWCILAFLNYPECQEKIYAEIESAIGDSGLPTMKHRDQMPYTCAFIQEILRHRPLLPLGVFHKASADVKFRGYTIPKDTTVMGNIWAVHFDPNTFDSPEEFRPERFLDKDGQFLKSNYVIPFSIGPRHCLGEHLARMELFIFLTGIVQRLRACPDPDHPPPDLHSGVFNMMFYDSHDYKVIFEKR